MAVGLAVRDRDPLRPRDHGRPHGCARASWSVSWPCDGDAAQIIDRGTNRGWSDANANEDQVSKGKGKGQG